MIIRHKNKYISILDTSYNEKLFKKDNIRFQIKGDNYDKEASVNRELTLNSDR